jgi:hypothetical protein
MARPCVRQSSARTLAITTDSFGILIAYLIPGFVLLWGLGGSVPFFRNWLAVPMETAPTVGDFLYATVASVAAGLLLSAFRWAVLDRLYHATGIHAPRWDFARLAEHLPAFEGIVSNHYRFYQAYGNSLLALLIIAAATLFSNPTWRDLVSARSLVLLAVALLLVLASRDTLRKYYARATQLMQLGSDHRQSLPSRGRTIPAADESDA